MDKIIPLLAIEENFCHNHLYIHSVLLRKNPLIFPLSIVT